MPLLTRWQWETWTQRRPLSRFTSSTHSSASPTATYSALLDSLPSLFGTLQASFRCCATHEYDTCGNHNAMAPPIPVARMPPTHQALTFPGTAGSSSLPWSGCKKTEGAKLGQGRYICISKKTQQEFKTDRTSQFNIS